MIATLAPLMSTTNWLIIILIIIIVLGVGGFFGFRR